jgi:hypothetical protein
MRLLVFDDDDDDDCEHEHEHEHEHEGKLYSDSVDVARELLDVHGVLPK